MGAVASFADQPPAEPFDVREFDDQPELWPGNPACSWFTGDGETTFTELTKFDSLGSGHAVDEVLPVQAGITVTVVDVKDNGEILEFDWSSISENVSMVIVKAGDDANLYVYNPPSDGDEGLLTVPGHGVSHISFCAGDISGEPPPPNPVYAPTASASGGCDTGVVVLLNNTGTDDDDDGQVYTTTYSVDVDINDVDTPAVDHDVDEGQQATVDGFALAHGDTWTVNITADQMDPYTTGGTANCPPDPDPDPDPEATPAAAFNHGCTADNTGVATVTLTNTGDADAEFTVVRGLASSTHTQSASVAQTVTVAPGDTHVESVTLTGSEVVDYLITSGETEWKFAADNDTCVTEVQGVVLENDPPTPNPAPAPAPEPQVQGEQLAATGFESPDLLLLAMLFAGLGLALLLSTTKPDPLVVRTH
jgi:hypothetical protein